MKKFGNEFFFYLFRNNGSNQCLRLLYLEIRIQLQAMLGEAAVLNASASGLMVKSRWERKKYESDRYVDICCAYVRAHFTVYGQILWQLMLTNVPSQSSGKQHRMDRFGCSCTCTPLESGASGIHLASLPLDHCHTFLSIHTYRTTSVYLRFLVLVRTLYVRNWNIERDFVESRNLGKRRDAASRRG